VDATLVLRTSSSLHDTSAIDASVLDAVRAYFDDRLDWYTWRSASLQSVLSRAHRRILVCSSVTVRGYTSGTALPDPSVTPGAAIFVHPYLGDNALTLTYRA
jgi:hypothetical protein